MREKTRDVYSLVMSLLAFSIPFAVVDMIGAICILSANWLLDMCNHR